MKYQFGSTPGVGCQDSSFTIKTMLHLWYNHNLPTFVMFADLVKDFDTSNHLAPRLASEATLARARACGAGLSRTLKHSNLPDLGRYQTRMMRAME